MGLHIGMEIRRILEEKGTKGSWLAEKLNMSDRNIYDLLNRSEISTRQLAEISNALEFDFFKLFQNELGWSNDLHVNEPEVTYQKKKQLVSILVQLDGEQKTLDMWIKKLQSINQIL